VITIQIVSFALNHWLREIVYDLFATVSLISFILLEEKWYLFFQIFTTGLVWINMPNRYQQQQLQLVTVVHPANPVFFLPATSYLLWEMP
jgi:hypothetical protein